tara:strand:- start:772 stop:1020 length:249 start_codon:yes stop_codon:yes gene_type:complete
MNNIEIMESIKEIVIDVLDIEDFDTFNLTESSKIEEYSEWDSLAHINIITQIESIFDIRFSLEEVENFNEISDFIKIINSRI